MIVDPDGQKVLELFRELQRARSEQSALESDFVTSYWTTKGFEDQHDAGLRHIRQLEEAMSKLLHLNER